MPDIEGQVTRREILKKGVLGAAGLTVLPAIVAACGGSSATPTAAPVATPATPTGPVITPGPTTPNYAGRTLTIWDYESADSAMGQSWAAAIDTFKSSHPGVTVTHEAKAFETIQSNASLILNSSAAPDVMEYNKGNATAGTLSTQGLLTDLSTLAVDRKWDKILAPSLQTTCTYSPGHSRELGLSNVPPSCTVPVPLSTALSMNVSLPVSGQSSSVGMIACTSSVR